MRDHLLVALLCASLAVACNGSSSAPVAAGQGSDAGADGDAGNPCASEGASCATAACCGSQPLQCMTDSVSGSVCRTSCAKNADCRTGCCDVSTGYCHDSLYCNCVDAGAVCASAGPNCCPGTTCLTYQADGGGPFACYPNCTKASDCTTGCCSQNIPGLTNGVCGPC